MLPKTLHEISNHQSDVVCVSVYLSKNIMQCVHFILGCVVVCVRIFI